MKKGFVGILFFVTACLAFGQTLEYGYNFSDIPEAGIIIGKTEVTQELYEAVMGENPSEFNGKKLPVEKVSWYDALVFCNKLSLMEGLTPVYSVDDITDTETWNYIPHKGNSIGGTIKQNWDADGYRLPEKNEWLLAARGNGETTYSGSDNLDDAAWYVGNSNRRTHAVGLKAPNSYGLFDMNGNVWEWCWDSSKGNAYYLGGSWSSGGISVSLKDKVTGTERQKQYNNLGFRIVSTDKTLTELKNAAALEAEAQSEAKPKKEKKEWKPHTVWTPEEIPAEVPHEPVCDFSVDAMIQLNGDLMNWNGERFSMFELDDYFPDSDTNYLCRFDADLEYCGGEIIFANYTYTYKYYNEVDDEVTVNEDRFVKSATLWVAPSDWFKLLVGNVGGQSIAYPYFGDWEPTAVNKGWGVGINLDLDGLKVSAAAIPGENKKEWDCWWFNPIAEGYAKIDSFWADMTLRVAEYAYFQVTAARKATVGAHGFNDDTLSDLAFGVALENMVPGRSGYFMDGYFSFGADSGMEFSRVDGQAGGQLYIGPFYLMMTNLLQYSEDSVRYGFEAKTGWEITDNVVPYIQVEGYKVMKSQLTAMIGADLSVGAVDVNACLEVPVDWSSGEYEFTFSMPVEFTIRM